MKYKKIEFKFFEKSGQEYLIDEKGFFKSENFSRIITKNNNSLGNMPDTINVALCSPITPDITHSAINNGYIYIQGIGNSSDLVELWKGKNNEAFTKVFTFTTQFDEDQGMISFKNKLIALGFLNGESKAYYSQDSGSSFNEITTLPDDTFNSFVIVGNTLYIEYLNSIYKSTDGITFELYLTVPSEYQFWYELIYLNGFLYTIIYSENNDDNFLCRIENNKIFNIKKIINPTSIFSDGNYIYITTLSEIINGKTSDAKILKFDLENLKEIYDFSYLFSYPVGIKIKTTYENKIFLSVDTWNDNQTEDYYKTFIFSIDSTDNVILEYILPITPTNTTFQEIITNNNVLHMVQYSDTGNIETAQIFNNFNRKYQANGNVELSIIEKGEIIPKQLIIRHKPLDIGCSVKIYTKKDFKTSWGTEILNSNTVGAIKKKYTYPTGIIQDFTQFKIELITTDETKTPKDIKLDFLYLPLGLENAK